MKERPILMSAPMVRALLDGSKTQTRRIMKPQPSSGFLARGIHSIVPQWPHQDGVRWFMRDGMSELVKSPHGGPGDRLWVRETFYAWGRWETRFNAQKSRDEWHFVDMTLDSGRVYSYAATSAHPGPKGLKRSGGVAPAWWKRPAIFMPRAASRINLEVTDVRVERLQAISEADAIAEGCTQNHNGYFWGGPHAVSGLKQMATAVSAYRDLWESINGPGSWDANPWVWVIEFRKEQP